MSRPAESMEQWLEALLSPELRASAAYKVADAAGLIKLDAMENPYSWPQEITDAVRARLDQAALNRYPDSQARVLKGRLRETMGIDRRWDILLGNGSDEIIQILTMALAMPGGKVLAPGPSFVMFGMVARWLHLEFVEVQLDGDFGLDMPAMLEAIATHRPRLIFLACPNNPSGNLFEESSLRSVLDASTGVVVIDEAYSAFSSRNHQHLLAEYPNLLLMRTLSKLGFAGLRLGYLVGDPRWIEQLDKLRLPYNIGTLNQIAAEVALERYPVLAAQTQLICSERKRLYEILCRDERLQCCASEANFLLVRLLRGAASAVHESMRKRGVLVKCLDGAHPLLRQCLRLTVGSENENQRMLEALRSALGDPLPTDGC